MMNSPDKHNLYTYSDPVLSLWQAAVAEVQRRHASVTNRMAMATSSRLATTPVPAQNELMSPVYLLGEPLKTKENVPADIYSTVAEPVTPSPAVAVSEAKALVPADCAKVAAQFLWAEMTGNKAKAELYAGELKDSACDIGWGECVVTYLAYKASGAKLLYRTNQNPVLDLGNRKTVAIVGDWGTGDEVAVNLLQQVASLKPEVLIHLGDVYYAGTHNEEQGNFLDIGRKLLGPSVPIFSLCGNHDMYSGGEGYYSLVDQLGQQASYFCLQNDNWQFIAMDTGHNDHNPLTVATNMTSLVKDESWAEEDWLLDKINLAKGRKTVLLSHHQLFSPFGAVGSVDGRPYAYNPNLRSTFQAVMDNVAWWFWGHEHTLAIFDSYMGLQRGRCVGASAVPVFTDQQSYANASDLETYGGAALPVWNAKAQVGNNGTSYNNCFAVMTLSGSSASVDYYQVPILGTATRLPVDDKA
jgi:Calcineurin-like phosphoesterase